MRNTYKTSRKKRIIKFAKKHIEELFNKAIEEYQINPYIASKYIDLILEISKRTNVRLPKKIKMFICKKCRNLLVPGKNATVRIDSRGHKLIIHCKVCGNIKRYPFVKEVKERRRKDRNIVKT